MLTVETIRKIRLAHHQGKSIHGIAGELRLSRNTVRKVIRSGLTEFGYKRCRQPCPKLGAFIEKLETLLLEDEPLPKKHRRTARRFFEELQGLGYEGAYDSVRRHVKKWKDERGRLTLPVFIPMSFAPGEAFQFDWSEEVVELSGVAVKINVAQIRLCHSRMFLAAAYPRQTQEMLFDAHNRAFEFFGGSCGRGIYDNPKTMVTKVGRGKQRVVHPRFSQLCSHYLFEPDFCTPAAGWEKGQVENQVGLVRRRFFTPRPKFKDFDELNAWLADQCLAWAMSRKHPKLDKTVWEVFQEERPHLISVPRPFDGYSCEHTRVSSLSLVRYDRNLYSVDCSFAGRPVEVRGYADKVVIVSEGRVVGSHKRATGRNRTVYDPWHYLPALERKPGALRNGEPFADWDLPKPVKEVRSRLAGAPDGDRQFVAILSAVQSHGLEAVAQACKDGLSKNAVGKELILNLLHRASDGSEPTDFSIENHLALGHEPIADCGRYDLLREGGLS